VCSHAAPPPRPVQQQLHRSPATPLCPPRSAASPASWSAAPMPRPRWTRWWTPAGCSSTCAQPSSATGTPAPWTASSGGGTHAAAGLQLKGCTGWAPPLPCCACWRGCHFGPAAIPLDVPAPCATSGVSALAAAHSPPLAPPCPSFPPRPEINARHNAFQRGSAYLERYCMLIAFTSYLQAGGERRGGGGAPCSSCSCSLDPCVW
jgi:hypothetical protein